MPEININNAADFLGADGQRLAQKRPELEKIANSADGKKVRDMLGADKIEQAAKTGDLAAIAAALQSALKTEEGARLANQLRELMK